MIFCGKASKLGGCARCGGLRARACLLRRKMQAELAERSNAPDLNHANDCFKGATQGRLCKQSGLSAITGSNPVLRKESKKMRGCSAVVSTRALGALNRGSTPRIPIAFVFRVTNCGPPCSNTRSVSAASLEHRGVQFCLRRKSSKTLYVCGNTARLLELITNQELAITLNSRKTALFIVRLALEISNNAY